MDERIDDILEFWFGDRQASDSAIAERQQGLWWGKDPATDAHINERFAEVLQQAIKGELEPWAETAAGRLALIIVLDQFPRTVYRGRAEAFAQDPTALAHSLQAQGRGQDRELRPIERVFVYMPMEHAEALMVQDESVLRFERLCDEVAEADRPAFEHFLDFARRHRDVILRFDRFPHRNAILGRPSTPAETAFLEQPDSSF